MPATISYFLEGGFSVWFMKLEYAVDSILVTNHLTTDACFDRHRSLDKCRSEEHVRKQAEGECTRAGKNTYLPVDRIRFSVFSPKSNLTLSLIGSWYAPYWFHFIPDAFWWLLIFLMFGVWLMPEMFRLLAHVSHTLTNARCSRHEQITSYINFHLLTC